MNRSDQHLGAESQRDMLVLMIEAFHGRDNDFGTRALLQRRCREYAEGLRKSGAVADYSICCDESNNPISAIESGHIRIDVLIQPAKSFKFIQFPIVIGPNVDEDNSN